MLFHNKGTVNIADVVRYTITYDPSSDPQNRPHGILSQLGSSSHIIPQRGHTLHLRIRNDASMLLRAAYLQGPYVLAVSVRDDTFCANDESVEVSGDTPPPVYDHDLKTRTSFWTELPADKKFPFLGFG